MQWRWRSRDVQCDTTGSDATINAGVVVLYEREACKQVAILGDMARHAPYAGRR
jgi:hypothetical protein